ncbi:hypothetical protein ERX46_08060 [Brumimicrobium glaciale]|uniref:GNAT family N-acetyltransferase n=1 Tax=Brumimicrobium glaciale TaxID=200475 RepID=A0A4Q4KPI0_9FLAO|nr:hypothetical protein [Brumimicrobium glaciale]RYM33909.1 hypothetical protein ERX46_08060 [Brumimicrobium glaciale]
MVKIESYTGENNEALIEFLSTDDFMPKSASSADSVIASILEYQNKTNNFGQIRGSVMLNGKSKIVGFLGTLALPASYKSKNYFCVQTSSAFVNKEYPGNFKKLVKHFIETNKNVPIFTIFPVPKIFNSFEKMGFVEVDTKRFKSNNYIVQDYLSFSRELFKNRRVLKLVVLPIAVLFNLIYKNTTNKSKLKSKLMINFNNDYSRIEIDYKARNSDLFVVDWTQELLKNKFSNKLNANRTNIKENEVIHICCYEENQIVGSIVLKKVRDYKRFIISDIQTTVNNRSEITYSLINAALNELKHFGFNSLMFFGLEEIYSEIISKRFKCFKKAVDKRVYYLPFKGIPPEKVSLVFSDDDLNY